MSETIEERLERKIASQLERILGGDFNLTVDSASAVAAALMPGDSVEFKNREANQSVLIVEEKQVAERARWAAAALRRQAKAFVAPEFLEAVLARAELADKWPTGVFDLFERQTDPLPPDVQRFIEDPKNAPPPTSTFTVRPTTESPRWPADVTLEEVAEWARPTLNRIGEANGMGAHGDHILAEVKRHDFFSPVVAVPLGGDGSDWILPFALALLYRAEREVRRAAQKPAIAIDAGKWNHGLLTGMIGETKKLRGTTPATEAVRIDLFVAKGQCLQLELDYPGTTPGEALVRRLREWRSAEGLRNWAALQRLLSVEGRRMGWVRWSLDNHMDALGYNRDERTRTELRRNVAEIVEQFTRMELAVYDVKGKERERRPLIIVGSKFDRLEGSEWQLDGMQLQINPLIYSGVRKAKGRTGSNFWWAPAELAKLDHARFPFAISLGLVLPIRFRWAHGDGKKALRLSGENILRAAGIAYRVKKPGLAWKQLTKSLTELQRIAVIERFEWVSGADTLAGVLEIEPALWTTDRAVRGVKPVERPTLSVVTGDDLREWRKSRGLQQAQVAQLLGVSQAAVSRAERTGGEALPGRMGERARAQLAPTAALPAPG